MKNKLECQVTACQHYCDGLCSLPGIHVDGPAALESSQTCCASFEERRQGAGENFASGGDLSAESSIKCSAEHCIHNESHKCRADCVCVGCTCGDACSCSKSGTECCTFQPR